MLGLHSMMNAEDERLLLSSLSKGLASHVLHFNQINMISFQFKLLI